MGSSIHDVLIVGGGPAGSACASKLRAAGLDVGIVDKAVFPRDKICGGWITPQVFDRFEIDPREYPCVLQPITAFRTGLIGAEPVETHYPSTVSYGIRRREFDHFLLRRSGARVFENTPVATIERAGGTWIVNGSLRARVLVGAGGHFCPVAHAMGAAGLNESPVVAQEIEFPVDDRCAIRGDTPELYFSRDLLGYGWCFRKAGVLNIGLGRADRRRLSQHVRAFIDWIAPRARVPIPRPRGHAYLVYGSSPRRIAGDDWLLIGDAAGLAYPFSGEGILPAIESGLIAAAAIVQSQIPQYPARLEAAFAAPAGWITSLGAHLPPRLLEAIAPRLLASPWFARHVILDRWFLHNPPEFSPLAPGP